MPALRDGIGQAGKALNGMLDADDAVLPVLDDWRALDESAKAAGAHWYGEDGRADVLGRMETLPELPHLDAVPCATVSPLSSGRAAASLHRREKFGPLAKRLRDCVEERGRLIEATGERRATYSLDPRLQAWRDEAGRLLDEARGLLDVGGSFAHADALPDLRDGIAEDREALTDAVSLDRRHADCVLARREIVKRTTEGPLFYREGNDDVVMRMRLTAMQPGLHEDARALLDRLVGEHDSAAAAKAEVEDLVGDLAFSLDLRKTMSDQAAPHGRSLTEEGTGYRLWSQQARQLCGTAERILGEQRYAIHLDRIEDARKDIERDRGRLEQALKTDDAYGELAPKLGRYDLGGPEQRRVAAEARRLLELPELDAGARKKLERQVGISDGARRRDIDESYGGGITP